MPDRYQEYRQIAANLNADAVALVPGSNFSRLFHTSFHSHERPLVVLIPKTGAPSAIVPNLELASFAKLNFEGEVFDWKDQTGYGSAFEALAKHQGLSRLAVEGQIMRVFVHHALKEAYPALNILDAEREISGLRMVKSESELAAMQQAIALSERALAQTIEQVRVGQTEKQIENLLTQFLFAQGAEAHAFGPIVAAGENSALPHAHARNDYSLRHGDALLIDFGARLDGHCADITRTFFIGKADEKAADVYRTVLAANKAGIAATRADITAHDVDDITTAVLEASPYEDRIRTKTGHGLGRDVHEAPYIMRGNTQKIPKGAVFTIEPGLYREGEFGVRIEDDVVVTDAGCTSLTTFPKDLMEIG